MFLKFHDSFWPAGSSQIYLRQKLVYLLHFSIIIITCSNNSRNQDISLASVRYSSANCNTFREIFWVVRSFFNSFVPQCNNTISGAKSTIQPLAWRIIPTVVAPEIDFTVVTYFVLFFILYESMFLAMESPSINNLFVLCWDYCDVFLAFYFFLLILLIQFSTSDETKLLSARPVLDNFWTYSSADIVGSFRGLLVVSCVIFNSLLFDYSSFTISRGWNWFLVSIVKLLRASQFLT